MSLWLPLWLRKTSEEPSDQQTVQVAWAIFLAGAGIFAAQLFWTMAIYFGLALMALGFAIGLPVILRSCSIYGWRAKGLWVVYLVAAIYLIFAIPDWLRVEPTIRFGDLYPREWLQPTKDESESLKLPNGSILNVPFKTERYRFTPVVGHGRLGETLIEVQLYVDIENRVTVKQDPHPSTGENLWRPFNAPDGFQRWGADINRIPYGVDAGADSSLWFTFPEPGLYSFRWRLRGETRARGLDRVKGEFKINLTQ